MKYFCMILCAIILSPFSCSQIKPKFCIDCKFYKKDFFTSSEFGKCVLFPYGAHDDYFLVNRKMDKNIEYYYCSTSRKSENMCGKEGKFFEKNKLDV